MRYLVHIVLITFTVACNTQELTHDNSSTGDSTNILEKPFEQYSSIFQSILLNESGVFRGHRFSDNYQTVLNNESPKLFEYDSTTLLIPIDLDLEYSCDFEYVFERNKLSKLTCIIYTSDLSKHSVLFAEVKEYFNHKYTAQVGEKWMMGKHHQIKIKEHRLNSNQELEIIFSSL
ncbi:hypothetical protein OAH12_01355 [Cyclobacteriaceae bacterium]|nr:hypothetical protein [Cyclobacteriaceae bacterium]